MARDANMSQSAFRANSSELESKVESLQLRTVWLEGLLSERERLHNESEEHRRNAEEMKAATEKLLAQAGQDLREAKESINEMHLQFEAYKESSLQVSHQWHSPRTYLIYCADNLVDNLVAALDWLCGRRLQPRDPREHALPDAGQAAGEH